MSGVLGPCPEKIRPRGGLFQNEKPFIGEVRQDEVAEEGWPGGAHFLDVIRLCKLDQVFFVVRNPHENTQGEIR